MGEIAAPVQVRPYKAGDEAQIVDLLRPHWTHLRGADALSKWSWEYLASPRPAIITVAECDHRIVGHYAILPMRMQCGRTVVWGGKAEGGIVDPAFRGAHGFSYLPKGETRTVYSLLITQTLERARDAGMQLVWGLPNVTAQQGQVKAGYTALSVPISRYILPVHPVRSLTQAATEIHGAKYPLRALRSLAIDSFRLLMRPNPQLALDPGLEVVDATSGKWGDDGLWPRHDGKTNSITVSRTTEYLQWRFIHNPNLPHRLLVSRRGKEATAYLCFAVHGIEGRIEGKVVDMIALESRERDLWALLAQAVRLMKQQGVAFITAWFARNKSLAVCRDALRHQSFMETSVHSIALLVKTYGLEDVGALDPQNWDLDMAFTEGVG